MNLRGIIRRWLAGPAPDDDFWYSAVPFASGGPVTASAAMQHTAVAGCVRILSHTIASLPVITYRRRADGGKDRAPDYWLHDLLRVRANRVQTSVEFWRMVVRHLALRGRAYVYTAPKGGRATELMPMHPDCVTVRRMADGRAMFRYTDPYTHESVEFGDGEVWFLKGDGDDPLDPCSPIEQHRRTIGDALTVDQYAGRFFENDGRPPGVVYTDKVFKDEPTRQAFKRSLHEAQTGANRGKLMVLEAGLKYQQTGLSNADAQFLETRRYNVADIARIFGVPLVLLQETDKATSWGTGLEQFNRMFLEHTIRPWLVLLESSILCHLVPEIDRREYFAEFMADALNRGQTKERYDAYAVGITHGFLTRNEVRGFENMNPMEGLDEPVMTLNIAKDKPAEEAEDEPVVDEEARAALAALTPRVDRIEQRSDQLTARIDGVSDGLSSKAESSDLHAANRFHVERLDSASAELRQQIASVSDHSQKTKETVDTDLAHFDGVLRANSGRIEEVEKQGHKLREKVEYQGKAIAAVGGKADALLGRGTRKRVTERDAHGEIVEIVETPVEH